MSDKDPWRNKYPWPTIHIKNKEVSVLPPLPEPAGGQGYTEAQMRSYALEAIRMARKLDANRSDAE